MQMILNFIAHAKPKLKIPILREALSVPETTGEDDVLDPQSIIRESSVTKLCRSLIRKSNDGCYYEFAHFSVKEFLEREMKTMPEFEKFQVSKSICELLLAKQCLKYLLFRDFSSLPLREAGLKDHVEMRTKQHPFYFYAAVCWPVFARPHWVDADLVDLAGRLFQSQKTGNFIAWALELTSFVAFIPYDGKFDSINMTDALDEFHLQQMSKLLPWVIDKNFTTLHMAAALSLEVICSSLIGEGPNIDQKSAFGCPLQCAVLGLYLTFQDDDEVDDIDMYYDNDYWRGHETSPGFGREETIKLLFKAGATHIRACSGLFAGQRLIQVAFKVAFRVKNFSAINVLLEAGHEVEEEDLIQIGGLRERINLHNPDGCDKYSLERLILCLGPMIDRSAAHFRLCQAAWGLSIEMGCRFVQDPSIVDTRISLSQDALAKTILKSIRDADNETLIEALKDPRADLARMTSDHNESMFEVSVRYFLSKRSLQRLNGLRILLSAGMEVNRRNDQGLLPIHVLADLMRSEGLINDDYRYDAVRNLIGEFIRKGTGCLARSRSNQNIFHIGLKSIGFVRAVLEAETDENTLAALRTRDDNGHTPIILALQRGWEDVALLLLERSKCDLESLRGPASVHVLCVAKGRHRTFNFLLDAGVTVDSCSTDVGKTTILHHLGPKTGKEFALQLVQMFPDELLFRDEGKLPLDVYLQNCIKSESSVVDSDVLRRLATPRSEELSHQNRKMVWEGFALSVRNMMRSKHNNARMYNNHEENTSKAIAGLLRLRFLHSYEAMTHAPGILPLLEPLQGNLNSLWPLSTKTICEILDQTTCWKSLRGCVDILKLLNAAVKSYDVSLVDLLLQKGVSVHQRIDEMSALEVACLEPTTSPASRHVFTLLLNHADVSRLDEINPHRGQQKGLIHYLAGSGKKWQLEEFIKRGANVDLRTSVHIEGQPAIVQHLWEESAETAITLLDSGANPETADHRGMNAALTAAAQGYLSFILHLRTMENQDWHLNWNQTCRAHFGGMRGLQLRLSGANALHLAAYYGFCDILRFYLDEDLLPDVNAVSIEFWTPIHVAAFNGQLHAIEFLHSRGGSIGPKSADGSLPLHLAVRNGHTSVVKFLIDHGSAMDADIHGLSPVGYAMQFQNRLILDCLRATKQFSDYQTEPKQHDKDVAHAFEQALIRGDIEYCKTLRSQGLPLSTDLPGPRDRSALMLAIENTKEELIQWLLINDAKGTRKALHIKMGQISPLQAMVMRPALNNILPVLLQKYESEGSPVIAETPSPICIAIRCNNMTGLKLLLRHTAIHETANS